MKTSGSFNNAYGSSHVQPLQWSLLLIPQYMRCLAFLSARCPHLSPYARLPRLRPLHLFTTTATLSFSRHEPLQLSRALSRNFPGNSKYLDLVLKKREVQNALYEKQLERQERRELKKAAFLEQRKPKREAVALSDKTMTEERRPIAFPTCPPSIRTALPLPKELAEVKYALRKPLAVTIPSVPQSILSHHYETTPPSSAQLQAANHFFLRHRSTPLFSTTKFFTQPLTGIPEVCFLGRSNAGKSSLLNALTAQDDLCHVSGRPGRTRRMAGYAVGGRQRDGKEGKLVLMDMPGYGQGSRPEWGREIGRYLASRKELRRVFVVIDANLGLKTHDREMLVLLRQQGISHQVLLGKVDRVLLMGLDKKGSRRTLPTITKEKHLTEVKLLREKVDRIMAIVQPQDGAGPGALGEILCVASTGAQVEKAGLGLDALRWAILQATGLSWSGEVVESKDMLEKEPDDVVVQRAVATRRYSHGNDE